MTPQRLNEIKNHAITCHNRLKKKGFLRRNTLPRITIWEHKWLCENRPNIARYTRCFEYAGNEFINDVDVASQARTPIIREVWVGARSLGSQLQDSSEVDPGDDLPAGFRKSNEEQEESAEVTELMTLLYDNQEAFTQWFAQEQERHITEVIARKPRLAHHRKKLTEIIKRLISSECPKNKDGVILPLMINDDVTGEMRPIRNGDILTTARGSNDDLDALFLEEGDDPREQNDWGAAGCDHRYTDRFRANNEQEEEMLQSHTYTIPNTAMPEGTRYHPEDQRIRGYAQELARKLVDMEPRYENQILKITDEFEEKLRHNSADVKFSEDGHLIQGYFVTRQEFFASIEENFLRRQHHNNSERPCALTLRSGAKIPGFKPAKAAPQPVDWDILSVGRGKN